MTSHRTRPRPFLTTFLTVLCLPLAASAVAPLVPV